MSILKSYILSDCRSKAFHFVTEIKSNNIAVIRQLFSFRQFDHVIGLGWFQETTLFLYFDYIDERLKCTWVEQTEF
jgi:hypothetical protein